MKLASFLDSVKLNLYEKEVILYLSSVYSADARTVYKNTKVPIGRVYSVLEELREKGFVSVVPTSPKKYRIVNVKDSLRQYIIRKKTALDQKLDCIEDLEIQPKSISRDKRGPSVVVLNGREEHLSAIISLRESSGTELLQIAPFFKGSTASRISMRRALIRGVKIRIIVKKMTDENRKNIEYGMKYGADIRQLDSPDPLSVLIKDSSEFLLGVQDCRNQEERMTILSTNKALLLSIKDTFLDQWKLSKPIR